MSNKVDMMKKVEAMSKKLMEDPECLKMFKRIEAAPEGTKFELSYKHLPDGGVKVEIDREFKHSPEGCVVN